MNLLSLSWKNILFKPWSTALTLVLFSLGVGLVTLLILLQTQLQQNFEKNLAGIDLVVGAKGSPLQLILCSMYHIDVPTGNVALSEARPFLNPKHPLIKKAVPMSLGDSYKGRRIVGTDTSMLSLYDAKIAEGKIWSRDLELTIGAEVASSLGLKIGDSFHSSHGFLDEEGLEHADSDPFVVVGILEPTGTVVDQLLLTTNQSFWLVHDHQGEETPEVENHNQAAAAHEEETHSQGAEESHEEQGHALEAGDTPKSLFEEDPDQEITSMLIQFRSRSNFRSLNLGRNINENTEMQAANPAYEINRLYSLMGSGERTLRILAMAIVLVSGLSIFISLYGSLRHRKYELALMRVMGGNRQTLFLLLLTEGILLAIVGSLLGILFGHVGMEVISAILQDNYRYPFTGLTWRNEEAFILLAGIGIGLVAALIPAFQASRTDISDTLTS